MGIWENLGMGGYRGFSRPAARLLQQAVQLAGDLGCEQADTSHLLLAMLQQQGAEKNYMMCCCCCQAVCMSTVYFSYALFTR